MNLPDNIFGTAAIITLISASLGTFVINIIKNLPSKLLSYIMYRFAYSISCDNYRDNTDVYENINTWLLSSNNKVIKNHTNIKSKWIRGNWENYSTLDYGNYLIIYDKCILYISKSSLSNINSDGNATMIDKLNIKIIGINAQKLKNDLEKFSMEEHVNDGDKFTGYILQDFGGSIETSIDKRNFDTIVSKHKDEIIDYIDKWKNNKEVYIKHGITYKTGIVLYGPPGTGKTTIAKAIASYLSYNLCIITNIRSINKLYMVKEKTVILLEDIDCMLDINREDKDENNTESNKTKNLLAEVLNAIDGVASPENVIFIITTNHIEKLDPALIRKGRFDLQVHIDNLDYNEALEMCNMFNISNPNEILKEFTLPINPSELQERLLREI